ncbi:MAG: hypothetical protein ACE5DM_04575 [Candidatus Nanoarchaeia archaeon]
MTDPDLEEITASGVRPIVRDAEKYYEAIRKDDRQAYDAPEVPKEKRLTTKDLTISAIQALIFTSTFINRVAGRSASPSLKVALALPALACGKAAYELGEYLGHPLHALGAYATLQAGSLVREWLR